jgi:uncharacterized membrane protein YqjE
MSAAPRETADLDTQPKRAEMTLGELFGEMTSELSTLFRKEVELAKSEGREEVKQAGVAAGWFIGTGLAALIALVMMSFAGAWLLDDAMPRSLAYAIVAVVWAIAAAVMFSAARKKMQQVEPLPQTTQTIKEDLQWAKTQTN